MQLLVAWEAEDGMQFYCFPAQDGTQGRAKVAFFYVDDLFASIRFMT